ncbi:multiubiquitin domain-containing protein [Variovorax sp. MHTC-1]|uniref:multiubiquitin domain-containing protein n=1 Tax=Variovorax sp. MHTC-1 TaxID=2495593 RepID=UPI000F86A892|nr:multiubiquitin domain-containing protein [Variovorax sp. MHTC-1]RST51284.1 hypothetical protein EJI01_19165 [Variovorax sp. MHTC-1]
MKTQHGSQDGDEQRIVILDEALQERTVDMNDPKVNATQLAAAAGYRSADEVIVLQRLKSGNLEEIRPDEVVDLREAGVERFYVIESDATYRFILDGMKIEWPKAKVNAALLRHLTGVDEDFDVILELEESPDRVLDDDDVVDLSGKGTERFRTKRAPKTVTVYYGEVPYEMPRGVYTTEQLKTKFQVEQGYVLAVFEGDRLVPLKPDQRVRLKNDMRFTSHAPCGQSS